MKSIKALIMVLMAVACGISTAQQIHIERLQGDKANRVNEYLQELTREGFSGSILVELDDQVTLKAGYGLANREKEIPFTPATISTIGSITKPLTATAILKMEQDGKLSLGDKLSTYLADLRPELGEITIEQLLLHQSGLGQIMTNDDFTMISRSDFIQRLNKENLKFEPGDQRSYSNIGYSVLAYLIEEISSTSYEDFMQQTFFIPLGMKKTGYEYYTWSLDSVAVGYKGNKAWGKVYERIKEMDGNYWNLIGNGGIHMDINELYTWYQAMKGSDVISRELTNRLIQPYVKCSDKSVTCFQGYAWLVLARDNGNELVAVTHAGGNDILYADFWWYEAENIFVTMLTNNKKYPAEDVLVEIRSMLRK